MVSKSKLSPATNTKIDEAAKTLSIPVTATNLDQLSDYPKAFLYLGQVLGREARAQELSAYARRTMSEIAKTVSSIHPQNRVTAYYAEGVDGLSTECHISMHTELIGMAGGQSSSLLDEKPLRYGQSFPRTDNTLQSGRDPGV